jgi:hypothetical protein
MYKGVYIRRCSDWEKKMEYRGIEVRFPAGMKNFLLYISLEYFLELIQRPNQSVCGVKWQEL